MKIKTDLFYVGGTPIPIYGKQRPSRTKAEWQLWFSQEFDGLYMPMVMDYSFRVKPTKKQIRKLRRSFRKLDGFCQ